MEQPSKVMKRSLRQLAALAHDEELRRALLPLAAAFEEWRAGRLESADLVEVIHQFHDGQAREIWKRYTYDPDTGVAQAIASGVIDRDKVPSDVLEHLRNAIQHFAKDPRAPIRPGSTEE